MRYALLYALLITLGLAILFWATSRYVDAQIAAGLEQELSRLMQIDRVSGRPRLIDDIRTRLDGTENRRLYYLLMDKEGARLAGNMLAWPPGVADDAKVANHWIEDDLLQGRSEDEDGFWPVIAARLHDGSRLLIAQNVHQSEDLQEFILGTMVIILGISIGLALLMGLFLGHELLSRIDIINTTARQVSRGDLSRRISLSAKDDEFDELGRHLNAMLERIEKLLTGMRQVSDNVAHDLRRPLTRIRSRLEVTLMETRDAREYQQVLEETLDDVSELMATFNALLKIAQVEAGSQRGEWQTVNVSTLLDEIGALYLDQAEVEAKCFRYEIQESLFIHGDRHLVAQAVMNLLDNAFKYTPDQGVIRLDAFAEQGKIVISVCDNGPGIPVEQRQHVLERFVRLDNSRNTRGNGLGLSLVKAVADIHQARLSLTEHAPGLCVSLEFTPSPVDVSGLDQKAESDDVA